MENKPKKLTLNQETLRNLTQEEAGKVAGFGTTRICTAACCTETCHILSICEICN